MLTMMLVPGSGADPGRAGDPERLLPQPRGLELQQPPRGCTRFQVGKVYYT